MVRAWRLAHRPQRADWSWSKVAEDLPAPLLDRLARTVGPLERAHMEHALFDLMALMADVGPELAGRGGAPPLDAAAREVAAMVRDMLWRPEAQA